MQEQLPGFFTEAVVGLVFSIELKSLTAGLHLTPSASMGWLPPMPVVPKATPSSSTMTDAIHSRQERAGVRIRGPKNRK